MSHTPNITLCWTCIHDEGGCQHPKKDDPIFWAKPTEKCYKPRRHIKIEGTVETPDIETLLAEEDI